jgi:RNA polymerase sigma factor (sigma-70 family)
MKQASPWSDEELLRRRIDGDETALAELIERHGDSVRTACARVLGRRAEAADAAQATFMVLSRRPDAALRAPNLSMWLRAVARRCALNLYRRERGVGTAIATVVDDPAKAVERDDDRRALNEELAKLPENLRAIFNLCEIDGVPQRDVARRLSIPIGSIARLRAQARRILIAALRRRGIDGAAVISAIAAGAACEATAVAATSITGATMTCTTLSAIALPVLASFTLSGGNTPGGSPGNDRPAIVEAAKIRHEAIFIVMNDGNLWQRSWQEDSKTWTWIFHGRPEQRWPLTPTTTSLMDGSKIFVIDSNGSLWERLKSHDGWEWIGHQTPPNVRLVSASGDGLGDAKIFALASNGHCYERWWDGKAWQWTDHGLPAATKYIEREAIPQARKSETKYLGPLGIPPREAPMDPDRR